MITTDPLADLFTRIRNGYLAHMDEVEAPYSKMKEAVLEVLAKGGFVEKAEVTEKKGHKMFTITLRYTGKKPALTRIERVSTPGRRMYVGAEEIPSVLGGLGLAIISTSSGVMTGKQAKQQRLGGELLGRVW